MFPRNLDLWPPTAPHRPCAVFALALLGLLPGCAGKHDDRVVITYWEK